MEYNPSLPPEVIAYFSKIGTVGGTNGRGKKKSRGSSSYYSKIAKLSAKVRRKNARKKVGR